MKVYRDRTRGRAREVGLYAVLLFAAGLNVVGALFQLLDDGGGWAVAWLAVTVLWAILVAMLLVRARRRDRAADAADPPRE